MPDRPWLYAGQTFRRRDLPGPDARRRWETDPDRLITILGISVDGMVAYRIDMPTLGAEPHVGSIPVERLALLRDDGFWTEVHT